MKTLNQHRLLWALLLIGLILRVVYLLTLEPLNAYGGGGDSGWYLQVGRDLLGIVDYRNIPIPVAPLYLIAVGLPQHLFSPSGAIIAIWIVQALASIATGFFIYRIGAALAKDWRVGIVACAAFMFSIAAIIEVGNILTETLYIFFLMLGLWFYIDGFMSDEITKLRRSLIIAHVGLSFGLAILTRPVLLLFPFGIVIHILLIRQWRYIPIFLSACAFITFSWTAYTSLYYNWTAIGSNQFMPAVWRGAVENDGSPRQNDELLDEQTAAEQASEIISSDPMGYVQRRIDELLAAYLQPHGTISFGQQSLKAMALDWLQSGLSSEGFAKLLGGEGFWMKLIIYIWHYMSLIGGFIGMWLTRRNWRISLVLIGFIIYTSVVHIVTLALPRYIFPTYPIWWIFAAVAIVALWDMWQTKAAKFVEEGATPPTKSKFL
jgi:hypothetical protein